MKVTIVGAGNVGSTCADVIASQSIASEVVLLDIKEGFAEGKALDMMQTSTTLGFGTKIAGTTGDYTLTANSDVVVITSGIPRKPGMTREELIEINAGIVNNVSDNILKHSIEQVVTDREIKLGDLVFNFYRGELRRGDYLIKLTDIEASLLRVLASRGGQIINRDDLGELTGANGGGRAVDVQVTRLRRKIEPNSKIPKYLQTVRGHGYVLKPD